MQTLWTELKPMLLQQYSPRMFRDSIVRFRANQGLNKEHEWSITGSFQLDAGQKLSLESWYCCARVGPGTPSLDRMFSACYRTSFNLSEWHGQIWAPQSALRLWNRVRVQMNENEVKTLECLKKRITVGHMKVVDLKTYCRVMILKSKSNTERREKTNCLLIDKEKSQLLSKNLLLKDNALFIMYIYLSCFTISSFQIWWINENIIYCTKFLKKNPELFVNEVFHQIPELPEDPA